MEFEQTQCIVTRIRHILEEYKYGDTVLLEQVQNADDAKASMMNILLQLPQRPNHLVVDTCGDVCAAVTYDDQRSSADNHCKKDSDVVEEGESCLVIHNDSIFNDDDLKNIQHIGGTESSSKRSDATKVGRFGIGFNSAFHLSDVVYFATGSTIVAFDPTKKHLPKFHNRDAVGGLRWNYLTHKCQTVEEQQFFNALLNAFEKTNLGFSRNREFAGTIFRLPLRQEPSQLSSEMHTSQEVLKLITDFRHCARLGMVLLKNIQTIEVSLQNCGTAALPQLLYKIESNGGRENSSRATTLSWLAEYTAVMKKISQESHELSLDEQREKQAELPAPTRVASTVTVTYMCSLPGYEEHGLIPGTRTTSTFRVHHQFGPGDGWEDSKCWEQAELAARYRQPIAVPWSASIVEDDRPSTESHFMCFFPIRRTTGFPVHLHGYFELSSDRQSIKDSTIPSWNAAMCAEVVPFAYCASIVGLCEQKKPSYGLWPHGSFVESSLKKIASKTVSLLAGTKTISTKSGLSAPSTTVFATGLSTTAHTIIANAIDVATIVTSPADHQHAARAEQELSMLHQVVETLRAHQFDVTAAAPSVFREAMCHPGSAEKATFDDSVIEELFIRCTDDEDFSAFADAAVPIVPMAFGHAGQLQNDDDSGTLLMMAPDDVTHSMCEQFPFGSRLVKNYLNSQTVQGIACRERLKRLVDGGYIKSLDEMQVFTEIKRTLSGATSLGLECNSQPSEASPQDWWLVLGSPQDDSTTKVEWTSLVTYLERASPRGLSMFAQLPLLPSATTCTVVQGKTMKRGRSKKFHLCENFYANCLFDRRFEDTESL